MQKVSERFDPASVEWRRVTDLSNPDYPIDFEYSLLGYDIEAGRLDMLLKYGKNRGHCRRHRHVAATVTLVLEGEQFVTDLLPDGSTRDVHRKAGDYAMAAGDAHPHNECGGDDGGTVLLSMNTPDGILFEYFDDSMENGWTVSIAEYVDAWEKGTIHGNAPGTSAAA